MVSLTFRLNLSITFKFNNEENNPLVFQEIFFISENYGNEKLSLYWFNDNISLQVLFQPLQVWTDANTTCELCQLYILKI